MASQVFQGLQICFKQVKKVMSTKCQWGFKSVEAHASIPWLAVALIQGVAGAIQLLRRQAKRPRDQATWFYWFYWQTPPAVSK